MVSRYPIKRRVAFGDFSTLKLNRQKNRQKNCRIGLKTKNNSVVWHRSRRDSLVEMKIAEKLTKIGYPLPGKYGLPRSRAWLRQGANFVAARKVAMALPLVGVKTWRTFLAEHGLSEVYLPTELDAEENAERINK